MLTEIDANILRSFKSTSLTKMASEFSNAWKDFMEVHRTCLNTTEKFAISLETQWFLYVMGYHQGRIDMAKIAQEQNHALSALVARCDGEQGVRADGSNIDTLHAHAALGDFDSKEENE